MRMMRAKSKAGYPKCKNLAFWGSHIGNSGLSSVASLIAASADSFTCGARLLLFELVGSENSRYNPCLSATSGAINLEPIGDSILPSASSSSAAAAAAAKDEEVDKLDSAQGYSLTAIEKLAAALSVRGCQLKALQLSNINLGDTGLKTLYRLGKKCE